jgi:glyoxylase-like metal-dependent hydrolase (beta-lactamase superfamily II)
MASVGSGSARLVHVLFDREWSDWVPIHAWLVEHEEGPILVDTGETARVHEPGYHPRWHPFFRLASRFTLESRPYGPFEKQMSLTRAGDVVILPTPGHTPGHVSVLVKGQPSFFLAGDTSYTEELLRRRVGATRLNGHTVLIPLK